MAINKKLIHFKNFSDFNSKKLSANENNTQYTLGINGAVTNGSPDILYQSICYIKDTKQQWTHGQLYDGTNLNEAGFLAGEETSDQLDDVETNTYVKYVPQTLTDEQKAQTRINIGAVSEDNFKTINGESILGSGNITIEGGVGTITGVSANGTSIATSGVANIPAASTSKYGVTKLTTSTNSSSTTLAATASAVKAAYDLANGRQDKLVSGTNIKTINGTSILGSGNIVISGGGGSSSGGNGAYSEVNHGTSDTTFTLTPNTFHVWGEVASLTLDLGSETAGVANEYLFQFTSGATATSLTLPDDIKWANDSAPTIGENMIYQVSILKGLASVLEFANTPDITLIDFTVDSSSFNAESGMLWSEWVASSYNTSGYITISNNKVQNVYTGGNLFTTSGVTVNSSDVVQPIKYTFTNPWA